MHARSGPSFGFMPPLTFAVFRTVAVRSMIQGELGSFVGARFPVDQCKLLRYQSL